MSPLSSSSRLPHLPTYHLTRSRAFCWHGNCSRSFPESLSREERIFWSTFSESLSSCVARASSPRSSLSPSLISIQDLSFIHVSHPLARVRRL
ncbi:uncharacterized protein LACBIDRAFT_296091 [Laccaria bicolor S238N-H82]|uniref:Predicted protein n=1 Tax=Laccaria bicolor (strain S238N-H82 / ATCC MYA-4686) TaxID=486041 RepID=B0E2U4_LACBS|nr:uncharacterized protein LACBIDRAFT_296091 [Laccaria bicolor S238N-H82]EDQ98840.1 predicted protein [Laccaria bicolor S238N-H82]|eukprot:XP_001890511.1 predicted protein [Laccaria bicolor S238N-H82]